MNARTLLPARRGGDTIGFSHGGHCYVATFACYPAGWERAGEVAEVFLSQARRASDMDVAAQDLAIVLSLALQWGARLDGIRRAASQAADGQAGGLLCALIDAIQACIAGAA